MIRIIFSIWLITLFTGCALQNEQPIAESLPLPEIVTKNGKHLFKVDGEPYLVLGIQSNNSSNYPDVLDDVWTAVEEMNANTLSIPVAWEQVEPKEGEFDFSYLDVLLQQARERNIRLNLLWFATWKNNNTQYAPAWVKLDNERFPRVVTKEGKTLNSYSPVHKSTFEADKKAFVRLMGYLKENDPQHTVIMVQIQNEPGTYGSKRDFSPVAEALFQSPVPEVVLSGLNLDKQGNWSQVFGKDSDEFFHAWFIAKYIGDIATAGKAVKNIPMTANAALRHPFHPGQWYSMGGPTDNVLDLYILAAPDLDMISPDIYFPDHKTATKVMELYARDDNPLYIAEIGRPQHYARYFFATMGYQGVGFCPFGIDYWDYSDAPYGEIKVNKEIISHFAEVYNLVSPFAQEWARLSFESQVWGVSEPNDTFNDPTAGEEKTAEQIKQNAHKHIQNLDLGKWDLEVSYGRGSFWVHPPKGNLPSSGGAMIAKLSEDEYLVTALRARLTFSPSEEIKDHRMIFERIEEGRFENGKWKMIRVWNGDQVDWGLNFNARPHLLKVKLASY